MSKTVYKTSNYEDLLRAQDKLKENGIKFEVKLNSSGSFFHNFLHILKKYPVSAGFL